SKEVFEKLRQASFQSRRTMRDLVREAVEKQLPSITPALTLDEIKAKAIPVLQAAGVTRAALFGSYARGDNRPDSDVDILFEPPERFSLFDHSGLKQDLEQALGKNVDVVSFRSIKPGLKESILASQIPLV